MRVTCSTNRKARLAQSYAAALIIACGAADEQLEAELTEPNQAESESGENDDEFRERRATPFSEPEKERAIELVEGAGIAAERVSFLGQLVFIDGDTQLELVLPPELGDSPNKGKVLGQIVNTGTPSLAPVIYARVSGGLWLFQRPDLEQNVLIIPDAAPAFVFEDFENAVAVVAAASSTDCLGPEFMTVMRQATYDALPLSKKRTRRTKTVAYELHACPAGHAGCAQFPVMQVVWIQPAGGGDPVQRERFVTGRRIGIDSSEVTASTSSTRALFVHELLHTLGIAHPKTESLGLEQSVSKLVVPGTIDGSCTEARCASDMNYPSIMHQARDLGRTNSLQPDDIDVIATLYTSAGGCGYRATPRVIVPQ